MQQKTENNKNEKQHSQRMTYYHLSLIEMIHSYLMKVLHHDYEWLPRLISQSLLQYLPKSYPGSGRYLATPPKAEQGRKNYHKLTTALFFCLLMCLQGLSNPRGLQYHHHTVKILFNFYQVSNTVCDNIHYQIVLEEYDFCNQKYMH